MWRERKRLPNAMNRCPAKTGPLGHRACRPLRGVSRGRLQSERQHTLHILVAELVGSAWPGLVYKAIQPRLKIASPPLAHGVLHGVQLAGNGGVAESIGSEQND